MKKRLLALLLALTLLTGCGVTPTTPMDEEPTGEGEIIAYVPLDDRPDNWERVLYLAESLDYQVVMPEPDLFRTRLNHQPANANGTQYGDRGALLQWVLDREAEGCDRYVLFLDQLLSGGLVNSRAMWEHQPIVLPNGTALTEFEAVDLLLTTLASDRDNRVWLLDSVMRLAPTVGYQHWTLEEYNALRDYGAMPRPDLTGDTLRLDKLEQTYPLGKDGTPLNPADFGLGEEELREYLAARSRKLELTDWVQTALIQPAFANFRLLLGIDDSSAEECIQKNEIAFLRSQLRPGDALLSGVDDLAFKAVAKLYMEETGWAGADVTVEYFGNMEHEAACAYDFQPLEKIMADHLDFLRLTPVEEHPEMAVLVLTQPADPTRQADYYEALIRRLQECKKAHLPVTLVDAGNGAYGTAFHQALADKTELGWLLSYAGFLDMAIVTGTALSHGAARLAALQSGEQSEAAQRAFARTLSDSVLKDFAYKHVVRPDLLTYVRDSGASPDNFWSPKADVEDFTAVMAAGMEKATAPLRKNLEQSNFIVSLEPYQEAGWGGVALANYRFPWDRAFEIAMDIKLGAFTEPHKKAFGVYLH